MPFEQLRELVVLLIEPEDRIQLELDEDPVAEFETQPTSLPQARVSTIDQLIAELPRYGPRFSRGSSPCLPCDPPIRSVAYTPSPDTEPSPPPAFPRRPRDLIRSGRGSPRR